MSPNQNCVLFPLRLLEIILAEQPVSMRTLQLVLLRASCAPRLLEDGGCLLREIPLCSCVCPSRMELIRVPRYFLWCIRARARREQTGQCSLPISTRNGIMRPTDPVRGDVSLYRTEATVVLGCHKANFALVRTGALRSVTDFAPRLCATSIESHAHKDSFSPNQFVHSFVVFW